MGAPFPSTLAECRLLKYHKMYMMSRNYPHLQSLFLKICGLSIFLPEGSHIKTSLLPGKEEALMCDLVYSDRLGVFGTRSAHEEGDLSGDRSPR
jgi:hypothetical protein